jgi:hypothetical protein
MKVETEKIFPYLKGRVIKIYNPFNFERIKKLAEDSNHLTEKEKKMLEDEYIVAVSRLDTLSKDYITLLKAFNNLKGKGMKYKLFIVGDGPSRKEIENQIKELNLEKSVRLLGQQKNPYIWLKNANLFVHSSKFEGLPTVLIEAMIVNTIVVSTDCPTGPREILENGECGVLVEVGNINGLANGILRGLEKKEEYIKKAEIRIKEFESENIMKKYEEMINILKEGEKN